MLGKNVGEITTPCTQLSEELLRRMQQVTAPR
jgi:hypothetical protein